ncbi:RNA-guided endonuclease InsQ/TnpB family protein [Acidithiobacillus thiooxidans]|uniref:Putative transposase InsQ for insertion sequence element IS609 n=1 Tax=Acidithiobacillus thiooxidans ATCC 19377 TaxID=637390 RepID=A0A543PZA4_ACITH|nr:transposase [Acidithiobacillus thiooxidans]MDX5936490.1 transposase [Acidithiobacillus thiooxidans]TQN49409.1 putative transposase InsQ for insertion sequence element IS609 [Acidithiobacillus thiooxidans ATCC 19377]
MLRKAVRYRLETTPEQEHLLARAAGCVRFVWNRALAIQKSYLEHGCGILSYVDMANCLTTWRNGESFGFLSESPVHPQQWALKYLDRALQEAFDKSNPKRFPAFKKKGLHDSIRYPGYPDPEQIKIDLKPQDADGRRLLPKIFLPRIGWVKFRKSCTIGREIRNVTVSRSGGHWTVAIQIEKEVLDPVHPSTTAVGGDRGVANLLTLSDGTLFLPVTAYRDLQKRLTREQRKLAHKVKFSANWKKQKAKITRFHQRIAEIRKNVLHQVSTAISKNHAVVVLENLKVRNMTGAARGTVEQPGPNIRQKAGLNKSILDQGWGMLKAMLEYKLRWSGGMLLLVDPAYTSQSCPVCGVVDAGNRPSQEVFHCLHCGHEAHTDLNAARNILARGLQSTAGRAGVACFAA